MSFDYRPLCDYSHKGSEKVIKICKSTFLGLVLFMEQLLQFLVHGFITEESKLM